MHTQVGVRGYDIGATKEIFEKLVNTNGEIMVIKSNFTRSKVVFRSFFTRLKCVFCRSSDQAS
jgi:hypothetical protein